MMARHVCGMCAFQLNMLYLAEHVFPSKSEPVPELTHSQLVNDIFPRHHSGGSGGHSGVVSWL